MKLNVAPLARAGLGVSVLGTIALLLRCGGDEFSAAGMTSDGGPEASDSGDELSSVVICDPCPTDQPGDAGADMDAGAVAISAAGEGGVDASDAGDGAFLDGASSCGPTELACDGGCISQNDIHNCGACGNDCALLPHVGADGLTCAGGRCGYQCASGFGDCADAAMGCTSLQSDPNNCGMCGHSCSAACGNAGCLAPASISAGNSTVCVLLSNNDVECWGDNTNGEVGSGSNVPSSLNVPTASLSIDVGAVSVGGDFACALLLGGDVQCWGNNVAGELGNSSRSSSPTPVLVTNVSKAIALTTGYEHACALISGGTVMCWGNNKSHQLGSTPTTALSTTAVAVSGLSGVTAIAAGSGFNCALLSGGTVQCWGDDRSGELNGMVTGSMPTPFAGPTLSNAAVAIAAGNTHACALLTNGTVTCWGGNQAGQLGLGSMSSTPSIGQVAGLTGVSAISAGGDHTCVLMAADGSVFCWGDNTSGQLGDGTTMSQSMPVAAVSAPTGTTGIPTALALGGSFTCMMFNSTKGTGVSCWGDDSSGQLGNGSLLSRLRPGPVQW